MNAASNFAYLKKKKAGPSKPILEKSIPVYEDEEPDTNVISVTFNTLKQAEDNIQMGDAYFCKHCKSCLSSISRVLTKSEYQEKFPVNDNSEEKEEEKEERKQEIPQSSKGKPIVTEIKDNEKVWICEFCGEHNLVNFDQEELPKTDDVIYLLKSAQQINKNSGDMNSDITTVFCIDNSGSMSVTHEIKGNHDLKHGLSPEEYEMLKQFIEAGAEQYLPRQKKGTTFISRKQCVLGAIESQLLEMREEFPNRKVGLVTFDNEVNVIGDGKNIPETVAGDKLYKYDVLRQIGEGLGSKLIATTVKESAHTLISKFEKLKESGKTALGPALLVSLGLALQGKQGSRIILCTDGLANVGLGEMDTPEGLAKAEQFYTELAQLAKEHGVSISVMSIKGEGCKLDILGRVADVTSGSLTRVDPNDMGGKFASIMKQEVIGTQVEVKLRLHRGMKFRNEAEENLKEKASLYEKDIGNVTSKTELTFEYEMRPDEELVELEIDATKLESVPFQAQIIYTSTNGDQLMRVITKTLKTTQNLDEAEKGLNVNLLAARALQQQAHFASKGLYMASNSVGGSWEKYFDQRVSSKVSKEGEEEVISKYKSKNTKMQQVSSKRSAALVSTVPVKEKEKPVPLKADKLEKPKPMAASSLKDKAPVKPVSKVPVASKLSMPMKKSALPTKAMPLAGKKVAEKIKKEEAEEEDGAEEDAEYELFHAAKNCNSNFE